MTTDNDASAATDWWQRGVIYQIYPRSYLDTNGDGVGDLAGIAARLDHVAALGADAVWIAPFFVSPMADFGYDVADHCQVAPMFGTMADFDAVLAQAHERGLRVLIDLVISHTSERHSWFAESRADRTNPKADWYVWADARPDGGPPNNWLSLFGGSSWTWDTRRRQYYLHNFLASQPDLNFHNEAVQQAVLDVVRFWLERGVDGFRLDTANFYFHDKALRDNPALGEGGQTVGVPESNPYSYQDHVYDKSRPENLAFLERLRRLVDTHPGTAMVGEIGPDRDPAGTTAAYTARGKRLHMAYTFNLLGETFSAGHIRRVVEEFDQAIGDGWPSWAMSNHDVARVISRWRLQEHGERAAPLLLALLMSLRGTPCIYQGEELGLPEAEIPFELLQDPYGRQFWPEFPGRDGCRTPMPWVAEALHAGFSVATPWLPVPLAHVQRAVSLQSADAASVLSRVQRFIHWRKTQPALQLGGIRFVDRVAAPLLCLERLLPGRTLRAVFNLGPFPMSLALPDALTFTPLDGHGFGGQMQGATLMLPGFDAFFAQRDEEQEESP
ncbi:alpha-amylase family glycosyl hydrolase [Variovorax sp.]|uniref:alpha-amylase family glycosyl hydrolase n=1 Tax=Variovorax sp. TaxID=1871043 RepID=UPI002D61D1BF|nr:alpha-amylase family glycosyl hydrolase [Variovorax sp.]HYP83183.1 alpha-amylase family glycosyl hydrolase [Variovorax sp.]